MRCLGLFVGILAVRGGRVWESLRVWTVAIGESGGSGGGGREGVGLAIFVW